MGAVVSLGHQQTSRYPRDTQLPHARSANLLPHGSHIQALSAGDLLREESVTLVLPSLCARLANCLASVTDGEVRESEKWGVHVCEGAAVGFCGRRQGGDRL